MFLVVGDDLLLSAQELSTHSIPNFKHHYQHIEVGIDIMAALEQDSVIAGNIEILVLSNGMPSVDLALCIDGMLCNLFQAFVVY